MVKKKKKKLTGKAVSAVSQIKQTRQGGGYSLPAPTNRNLLAGAFLLLSHLPPLFH